MAMRKLLSLSAAAATALSLAACGEGKEGGASQVDVAYFTPARSNTWVASTLTEIESIGKAKGVKITVFDSNFDPSKQSSQIQDALVGDRFDAFLITPIDNTTIIPDVENAISQDIPVASTNTALGPDTATNEVQVEGLTYSSMTPSDRLGSLVGKATVQACADKNPCRIAYVGGNPAVSFETVKYKSFKSVIDESPNIELVARTNGGYLADPSRRAMQDVIQTHPDINVVATIGDQMADGAAQAAKDAGSDYVVIGQGASEIALKGVKDGSWYASVIGLPAQEGKLAFEALLEAIDGKTPAQDHGDPIEEGGFPEGIMTKEFLAKHPDFKPEWTG